jgi:ATP-dependent Lon protease
MRFESDQKSKGKNPFWIDKLVPIQIATFDLDDYRNVRKQFTTDEWIDLIVRSMGYEPGEMSRRLKLLFLVRLIPLGERNYNLVELGPRGTGKSYVIQEVSPYTALLTGGTTVANLFGHMSGRQKGMVQIWDVVGFDEVAEPCGMPRRLSRASVVRVFLPRSSVSSTGHSSHILIRCSTRRSTIRRATDLRSSACGMLPK